jgi:hypothetical protein
MFTFMLNKTERGAATDDKLFRTGREIIERSDGLGRVDKARVYGMLESRL